MVPAAGGGPGGGGGGGAPAPVAPAWFRIAVASAIVLYWFAVLTIDLLVAEFEAPLWLDGLGVCLLGYLLGISVADIVLLRRPAGTAP